MGLHKLTAGDGYTYLTRQVAAHDATERGHGSLADYYEQQGESPGRWVGTGLAGLGMAEGEAVTEAQMKALFGAGRHPNADALAAEVRDRGGTAAEAATAGALGKPFQVYAGAPAFQVEVAKAFTAHNLDQGVHWRTPIPAEDRARIRTEIATHRFTDTHGRPPENPRELAGFLANQSRQATTAVAGYDLTFSPVKTVSVLWALAPRHLAGEIAAAHHAAVTDTLEWLEREVAYTRVGRGGARQVPVRGLVAAAFTHRDSRAGDPDLHTHVAVANKVQTSDGRWLALDGRVLYRAKVAASERYNTRLEAELVTRLGVRFLDRPTPAGKRPVREIDGVDPLLAQYWSRRRKAIDTHRARLAAQFQRDHHRPPTAVEALALAQQATLETRQAKRAPRSEAEQRAEWRRQAVAVFVDESAIGAMIRRALHPDPVTNPTPGVAPVAEVAREVVTQLEASRATWTLWHVRAETERQVRRTGIPAPDLEETVQAIVDQVLTVESVRLGEPDPVTEPPLLRRPDGESVYEVHGTTRYTSTRILAAEQRILSAAHQQGGRSVSEVRVGIALAEAAANGVPLNDAQTALVRTLATSGARVQLALAPAGTGKTTTMRVLADAWTDAGGTVLGLAPSAAAAQALGDAVACPTDTLAKLTWSLHHSPTTAWPGWMTRIDAGTLVILDEAGQAGTTELADAVDFLLNRGACVRLVGDDQQLAAVAAGGVLRDLATTVGAATLSEVRRFTDPAEAAATLAVRDGDPTALGFYADHGRIHVGDQATAADQAYAAWATDRAAGLDAILLAPTRELVTELNQRARADRLTTARAPGESSGEAGEPVAEVLLVDGTRASVGDTVLTRRNERRLPLTATDWVKNGDRWTIEAVTSTGGLRVRHLRLRRTVVLPAEYVREHVQLGYTTTVHAAQGLTTDTAHTVVSGEEPRQLLYVALSRGRTSNHLYLATAADGDPHSLVRPETLLPPTALEVLTTILGRDGSQHSAITTRRDLDAPATRLHEAALRYHDALAVAAEEHLGTQALAELDQQAELLRPRLTTEPAYPTLRGHLALRALDGEDPVHLLADALTSGELDSPADPAADAAAVLDWRLHTPRAEGPLPWLAAVPTALERSPEWGDYLRARAARVEALAAAVRGEAAGWSPTQTPAWATHLTGDQHADPHADPHADSRADLRADLAVWRAAYGVPDTDLRPTGPRQHAADAERHQRDLDRRVRGALGHSRSTGSWSDLVPDPVAVDPQVGRLLEHLAALDRAGIDVPALLHHALSEPRPLPTEVPADALWWRIVGHLGPAALPATGSHQTDALRPTWTGLLTELLGPAAQRVLGDPAWPALVAAVHAATDWTPEPLLESVVDGLRAADGFRVPEEELCTALVWRIATLTDPPHDADESLPPDPADDDLAPPADLHLHVPRPAPDPGTSVERILELNEQAGVYYTELYPISWAPAYLRGRLGSDLLDDDRFTVGYAPPGPTALLRHLTAHGATEAELLDAGLVRRTDRGHVVDAFRDRLVFPIHHGEDIVGFIGRRNPNRDHDDYAGPKYLNTRATAVFTKGHLLYGLTKGSPALHAGAAPVLVEGPLDAIAVTLASRGTAVGIAPLGTAFTPEQAKRLKPLLNGDPSRVVIATDPDAAGWLSAQRAFWQLAAIGGDPRHVDLPAGLDPADLLKEAGDDALRMRLEQARPFATSLIDRLLDSQPAEELQLPATRLRLVRQTAQIIGAVPPDRWLRHIQPVTERLHLPPGMLNLEVLNAGHTWTQHPDGTATQRIDEIRTASSTPRKPAPVRDELTKRTTTRAMPPPSHTKEPLRRPDTHARAFAQRSDTRTRPQR